MEEWLKEREAGSVEWLLEGRKRFIESLPNQEYRQLMEQRTKGSPTVVLFGITQVGKTELLLRMMGVDVSAPQLVELKMALRGFRNIGESATATATIFSLHEGNDYIFETPLDWNSGQRQYRCKTPKELGKHLASVRSNLQPEKSISLNPIKISLPKHLATQTQDLSNIRIIDLPGFGSNDSNEHQQVQALLHRYIPSAMVVIIVVHGTSFQNPLTAIQKEFQKDFPDWGYNTQRYRLILTHALSPNSVIEANLQTYTELQQHYQQQLMGVLPEGIPIYPLEYGDTWQKFQQDHPQKSKHFAPLFQQTINRLVSDLPETSIIQATLDLQEYWKTLEKVMSDRIKEMEVSIAEQREKLNQYKLERDIVQKQHERYRMERFALRKTHTPGPNLPWQALPQNKNDTAKDFRKFIRNSQSQFQAQYHQYLITLGNLTSQPHKVIPSTQKLDENLEKVHNEIDWTFSATYWTDDGQKEDREKCNKALRKYRKELLNIMQKEQQYCQEILTNQYNQKCEKIQQRLALFTSDLQRRNHKIQKLQNNLFEKEQTLEQFKMETMESTKAAQNFDVILQQALQQWGSAKVNTILNNRQHSTTERIEGMLDILTAYQLARSRDIIK